MAISAQYSVSKLYNDPLLRTSISLVASSEGSKQGADGSKDDDGDSLSKSVSTALLLAGVVGLIQVGGSIEHVGPSIILRLSSTLFHVQRQHTHETKTKHGNTHTQGVVYSLCAAPIIRAMGVGVGSEMYVTMSTITTPQPPP